MNEPLRLIFMGTPELARTVLAKLVAAPFARVLAVVVQPDRPVGRHLQLTPPPVKVEAQQRGIPVLQPLKARDPAFLEALRPFAPDLIVVAAYGQILPAALLELPRWGCLNVHTSLLPRWRGAAPIQRAIATGDPETGVTIMKMDPGLDTGPTLSAVRTPITSDDTSQTLHDRLAQLGGELLVATIPDYVAGRLVSIPQPSDGVTYAPKVSKDEGRLDWAQPASVLSCRIRAFTPWPGSFCFVPAEPKPKLLKIHKALECAGNPSARPGDVIEVSPAGLVIACGDRALQLTEVQLEGGRKLTASEFLAGHRLTRLD